MSESGPVAAASIKLDINSAGVAALIGVPPSLRDEFVFWLGARAIPGYPGVLGIPHRMCWAVLAHYRGVVEATHRMTTWLNNQFSRNAVLARVSAHLKTYRGGYEAREVAKGVAARRWAYWIDGGGGKTTILCEIAKLVGPMVFVLPPQIWQDAYVNRERRPDGKFKGDLVRDYPSMRYVELMGSHEHREDKLTRLRQPADIYAISTHLIGSVVHELLDIPWAGFAIDEAISVKNPKSEPAKACRKLKEQALFRFEANAEPSPSNVGELWSQIDLLDSGVFGPESAFRKQYAERAENGAVVYSHAASAQVLEEVRNAEIATFMDQSQFWPERPKLVIKRVVVKLTDKLQEAYDSVMMSMRVRLTNEKNLTLKSAIERVMKARQITAGFVYDRRRQKHKLDTSPKIDMFAQLLTTSPKAGGMAGASSLVWCEFKPEYEYVCRMLERIGVKHGLYRGRDKASRQAKNDFSSGRIRALVTHARSAGHGLRFADVCYNAAYLSMNRQGDSFRQSYLRIYRPPQPRDTVLWMFVAEGTIDEDIADIHLGRRTWRDVLKKNLGVDLDPKDGKVAV